MRLLGREQITATGYSQSIVNGEIVLSGGSTATVWGSVQPVGQAQIELLPEAARRSARWVVYTEGDVGRVSHLKPGQIRFATSKGTLMPIAEIDHVAHVSGLPHVAYICAEVGSDE